jgi:hypothetical protein
MRSNQAFSIFFLATWLAGPLWVQAGEEPMLRADFDYATQYVFRGVPRTGASAQAAVVWARDNFRGGVWTNQPFRSGEEREVNLGAAYSWQAMEGLTLEMSAAQYWYSNLPAAGASHSFETGLTATTAPIHGFIPSLAYYHDFRLRTDTTQVSLAHSIALTGLGAYLDLSVFAGWAKGDDWRPDTPGPRRHDSYRYWGAEAHLPYRIGPHSTIIAGLHYADTFGRSATNGPFGLAGGQNLWATLGVSLDF